MYTHCHTVPSYIIKICTQNFFQNYITAKFEGTMYTFYIGICVLTTTISCLFTFYFIFPVFGLLVRLLCNDLAPSIIWASTSFNSSSRSFLDNLKALDFKVPISKGKILAASDRSLPKS